ncbi:hypothetical protein HIM_02638 [Hirsutella minnesotensis 3608]|nr:hypothetical protein HIM_02638 [Hirsutella minnesotensis 3608]
MPTYLCHGFRWLRNSIRIFVIVHDLEDVAPDWIVGPVSAPIILDEFLQTYKYLPSPASTSADEAERRGREHAGKRPSHQLDELSPPPPRVPASEDGVLKYDWSPVKLLEEYDAEETATATRPYAYVADYVVRVDLGADVAKEMAKYEASAEERGDARWFDRFKDELEGGEEVQWYVVVCSDEERSVPAEASSAPRVDDEQKQSATAPVTQLPLHMKPAGREATSEGPGAE